MPGRTIKLFLVEGVPDGIRTAEIMSWTGHVLFAPRSRVAALMSRPEVKRTGAYILIGPNPANTDQLMVYVGEGDNVGVRIAIHNKDPDKDFWENACVVTSKDLNVTKAHARYLESRLINLISAEGRVALKNRSEPEFAGLPEADLADMEDFIAHLQILLPVLGADFVKPAPQIRPSQVPLFEALDGKRTSTAAPLGAPLDAGATSRPSPEFKLVAAGIAARAVEVDGQMVVLAGSQARKEDQPSLSFSSRTRRDQLRTQGKLVPGEVSDCLRFAEDTAFPSPSAAAEGVMGTSRNGRRDWVTADTGETYAEWQERQVLSAERQVFSVADETPA